MPTSRCLLITAPGVISVGETEIPAPGPGEVLIRVAWSCISPGTELRCLAGKQSGAPAFPFIPGYALSGRVAALGPDLGGDFAPGDAVFCSGTQRSSMACCWGGHAELAVVKAADVIRVPSGLDLRHASAAKLAAIAYHGVRLSLPLPHERVVVIGLGPIGRFSAELHALAGARVFATDLSPRRREQARAAGLEVFEPGPDLAVAFAHACPEGAHVAVDATGAPPVLAQVVRMIRPLPWDNGNHSPARLLIQGSYSAPPAIPYDDLFMTEARLLTPRDCQRQDIETVLDLMARGKLRVDASVSDAGDPASAAEVYETLRTKPDQQITAAFRWS